MEYIKKNKKSKARQKTTRIRLKNKQSAWACAEVWGAIGPEEGRLFHLSLLCSHCTWTDNNMYIFKIHID